MKTKPIWKIAHSNKKLADNFYKSMMKRSPFVVKMSLSKFKQCYHSKYTLPEYRAILISSLYERRPNYSDIFRSEYSHRLTPTSSIKLEAVSVKGENAFSLNIREHDRKPQRLGLTPDVKGFIREWDVPRNREVVLEKALLSNNIHYQKVAMGMAEMRKLLYATADSMKLFVFINDPRLVYNSSPISQDAEDKVAEHYSPYAGQHKEGVAEFYNHLSLFWNDLNKFKPYFEKLGLDVHDLEERMEIVGGLLQSISMTEYETTYHPKGYGDYYDDLYEVYALGRPLAQAAYELAKDLENIDINDDLIYKIGRLEVMPTFNDPSLSVRVLSHRSNALNAGSSHALKMTIYKLTPAKIRDIEHPEIALEWSLRKRKGLRWLDPLKDTS